jgi:hypothetical protein
MRRLEQAPSDALKRAAILCETSLNPRASMLANIWVSIPTKRLAEGVL